MASRTRALLMMFAGAACLWAAKDSCFDCHAVMEGTSVTFKADIHYSNGVGSSRVDLQACKLEYSIVSPK